MPQLAPIRRLLTLSAPAALALALAASGGAFAEICEDCGGEGGSGGGGSTLATPTTTITSGPVATYYDTTPTFTFTSDLANVRYRCRITTGGVTGAAYDCGTTTTAGSTTSHTLPEQPDGSYTMSIAACKDYTGTTTATRCDGTPATHAYTIDTVRPDLTVTGPASGGHFREAPTWTVSSTASDLRYFRCGIDGSSSWGECGPTITWPADAAEGEHTVYIHSYDWAGNLSSNMEGRSWVKDTIAPVHTLSGPEGATNVRRPRWTWTITDADAQAEAECHLQGPGVDRAIPECTGTSWTADQDLADGEWKFWVKIVDRAGNASSWRNKVVQVDTVAPTIGEIAWNATTERLTFASQEGTLKCRFDDGEPFACSNDVDAGGLDDGEHRLTVTVTDAAGNATTKSKDFRIGAAPAEGGGAGDGGGSGDGGTTGGGTTGGSATSGDAPVAPGPALPAGAPSSPATGVPAGASAPLPTATPAKKTAKKKRCRTVKRKVRGKTRKVRTCKKAKKGRRAAARRRA